MMNHLSEEELILHYYSEEADAFAAVEHLDRCDECRAHYASLQRVLNVVDTLPVPERGEEYGAEVWRRIEGRLPSPPPLVDVGGLVALGRRGGGVRLAAGGGVRGGPHVPDGEPQGRYGGNMRR